MKSSANDEEEYDDRVGGPVGPLPSVSSRINFPDRKEKEPVHDLWIVGAGTLGKIVAKLWKERYPGSSIITETRTASRHKEYSDEGYQPRLRSQRSKEDIMSAKNVLICFSPYGITDYEFELNDGCGMWSGPDEGNLLFTSTTAVYGDGSKDVTETTMVDSRSGRAKKLV